MENNNLIPPTETPTGVYLILLTIIISLLLFISYFVEFSPALIILCVILAFTTHIYTESDVPAFHALILISSLSGKMRTIFPGLNPKLLWESAQLNKEGKKKYVDLRVELKEVLEETYTAKDALMKAKYVYTIKPDVSGYNPGEKIILFSSFDPDTIKQKGRALCSMLLSDHFSGEFGQTLLDKETVNKEVFDNNKLIAKFEQGHGVKITARLEDCDFSAEAQEFRDMISKSRSIDDAITILVKDTKLPDGTIIKGMSRDKAEKMVKLMHLDGYKETDFNLNVSAPDLINLQNISVVGLPINDEKKEKGGKK